VVWDLPHFDLVLKKGHVVDPAQGVDAVLDLAIAHKRIARALHQCGLYA